MRKRQFNITGLCVPEYDYMVDINGRVDKVKEMVDEGLYFTINRPRQYGKTTLISALTRRLSNEYICASISFEGLGDESFENAAAFCDALMNKIQTALSESPVVYESNYADSWMNADVNSFISLDKHITAMCGDKKVVLIIDEVDKTSDNRVFIHFIGLLRQKFLSRKNNQGSTFKSVILAGVHDIRNLKVKLANEGVYSPSERQAPLLNSPWNIAADFLVDMSFHPADIATMLYNYETDHSTGMDVYRVSETIYEYTGGYPFLVSKICQLLDKDKSLLQDWTPRGARNAVKLLIRQSNTVFGQNTLFDDISKNLENYPDLYSFIYDILILGKRKNYLNAVPTIQRAAMFGIISNNNGYAQVSNRIFEIVCSDYFIAKDDENRGHNQITGYHGDIILGGRFDMERCLIKFAEHFRQTFTEDSAPFIEEHGRMLFLTYLKPLINGNGFYHIESRLTDQRRMDLVVDFGPDQFVVELKLWYGESAHEKAYDQLAGYLKSKGMTIGYLLTYDFRKDKNRSPRARWIDWDGTRVFDVVL
ncbi:MAG: AAA-like domain-containing protein [Clostridiales bacterium]|nr:AAA-like domain-containing protein [Clostridiales bacterium]